jgi:hypothetical protein
VEVNSADIIASVLSVKTELELQFNSQMKITLSGATEAHLLAEEIARAEVGVILRPSRPYPGSWQGRRMCVKPLVIFSLNLIILRLPGPPLTDHSAFSKLLAHNITVGMGVEELWECRNIRFDAAWVCIPLQTTVLLIHMDYRLLLIREVE